MSGDTLTTLQKALKNHYKPRMAKSILSNISMWKVVQDVSENVKRGGRDFAMYWPIQTRYAWGTAAGTEGGDFGTPDSTGISEWTAGVVRVNSNGEITGDVIDNARSQPNLAYLEDPMNFMMDQVKTVASLVIGWQCFGDGSGAIAQVDTAQGAIQATYFFVDNPGATWLHEGMLIGVYTNNTTGSTNQFSGAAFQRITQLVREAATGNYRVYVASTTGAADNYYVYQKGHYGIAALTGLSAIVDDGTVAPTFQGQTRATNQWACARAYSLGGNPINESALFPVFADLVMRNPGKKITHLVTDPITLSWLALSILDRQRFEGQNVNGGFDEVIWHTPFGKITVMADPLCVPGKIFVLNAEELGIGWGTKPGGGWFDEDGLPLKARVSSGSGTGYADSYVCTWRMILQMTCNVPQDFALIYNYTSP